MFVEESTGASQDLDFSQPSAAGELEDLMNDSEQQTETAEGSSPEPNEAEESPSQEGENISSEESVDTTDENTPDAKQEIPLNKDARWQEKLKENQELKTKLSQQQEMIEKLMQLAQPQKDSKESEEVPQVFKQAFGTGNEEQDKQAWEVYKQLMDFQKKSILEEIRQQETAKTEEEAKFDAWLGDQVELFQSQGVEISKDEFLSILQEYEPSNGLKSYDAQKVLKIHQLKKELEQAKLGEAKDKQKEKQNARKSLAAMSASNTPTSPDKEFYTLEDSPRWKQQLKA